LSFEEFGRTGQKNSREAAAEQSPGLAALFAAYLKGVPHENSVVAYFMWVRASARTLEFLHLSFEEFGRTGQKNSREAAAEQSPGLAALFAAYPGEESHLRSTLKG